MQVQEPFNYTRFYLGTKALSFKSEPEVLCKSKSVIAQGLVFEPDPFALSQSLELLQELWDASKPNVLPTKSLWGPTSIEFQLKETWDGQLV